MNDLELRQQQEVSNWMNPKTLIDRLNRLKDIQKQVMRKDVHYGVIPGCNQNSLYQPGSQVLCVAFGLGQEPENVDEYRDSDEVRYRIKTRVFDQKTGNTITYGTGEASSSEDKYAWRKPKGKEWENTPDDRRRIKYSSYNGQDTETQQVRTNPADVANTILKMATKRSEVNGTIKALAASEVFTQDIEDLPEGMDMDQRKSSKPSVNPDDVKSTAPVSANHPQGLPVAIGIVQDVKVKEGIGKTKDGKMFFVTINNVSCSTFNLKLGAVATALKGKEVEYTTEVNGKYINLMSIQAATKPPETGKEPTKGTDPTPNTTEVEDAASYASTLVMVGSDAGLTEAKITGILLAEFNCSIDTVPAELQAKVLERIKTA